MALLVSTLSSHAKVILIELFISGRLLSQGILILIAYLTDGLFSFYNIAGMSIMIDKDFHVVELLNWIEDNLHLNLSAERISKKSGYSKWYLQRMFKACTGYTMVEYIRARRLCKAAMDLKLSKKNLTDIAESYHFSSQSSFTRSFTSYYGMSPVRYRDCNGINLGEFVSLHTISTDSENISCEYVPFDHLVLYGIESHYFCPVSEIKKPHRLYRQEVRKKFINDNSLYNSNAFTLGRFEPHDESIFKCEFYIGAESAAPSLTPLPIISGDYLKFYYEGHEDGIYDFVMSVYFNFLGEFKFQRRKDFDLEVFNYIDDCHVRYSYFIPIHFDVTNMLNLSALERRM